jgi:hypothetical protein
MSAFSPTAAAFEGFRVLRRAPGAVAAWMAGNILLFLLIGLSKLGQPQAAPYAGPPTVAHTIGRFGPLAYLAAPTLLIFWIAVVGAILRQELRPKESRWAYMRLGADELRLAGLGLLGAALVLFLAGVQFAAAAGLTAFLGQTYPDAVIPMTMVAAAAASCFNFWIVVRLSLAPAHTFAARRLSMFGSWALTRRHFWDLGWMIFLMIVTVFLVFLVLTLVAGFLGGASLRALDAHRLVQPTAATLAGLFVVILLLTAAQVLVAVIVYAPLAYAYRALAAPADTHRTEAVEAVHPAV